VLKEMKKGITPDQARAAVEACVAAGIKAAGFFMVGYLGETTDSLIRSINFSSSLPLDYVSYTIAYPLPGTGFYERVREGGQSFPARHRPGITRAQVAAALVGLAAIACGGSAPATSTRAYPESGLVLL